MFLKIATLVSTLSTHLLARWTFGETPKSPKRVTNTLASVPAPFTSPLTVTTSYTERQTKGEVTKSILKRQKEPKKNSTVSSHPMIYESCWQCCVSSHASLPGNSMRQICSDSMPGETCWPSMSQISTNTRLFVWRLVYWEVNGVKTLLCACKVAKFARGRQPTKKGDRCAPGTRAVFASIFSCDAGIFFFMGILQLIC